MVAVCFENSVIVLVGFVGLSGYRRYVNSAVMKTVFHRMAEEKKFYRRGLFRIKIEIVYIHIASKHCMVGVQRIGLVSFHTRPAEVWGAMA